MKTDKPITEWQGHNLDLQNKKLHQSIGPMILKREIPELVAQEVLQALHRKPVARVYKNEKGDVWLIGADGGFFDLGDYVGAVLYVDEPSQ